MLGDSGFEEFFVVVFGNFSYFSECLLKASKSFPRPELLFFLSLEERGGDFTIGVFDFGVPVLTIYIFILIFFLFFNIFNIFNIFLIF